MPLDSSRSPAAEAPAKSASGPWLKAAWCLTALLGALAVALGAYAAHGMADQAAAATVNTAVRYQMWHTLALVALLVWQQGAPHLRLWPVMALWLCGTAAFSGSLYALAFTDLAVGLVTPLGGLLLISGWLGLGVMSLRVKAG